MQNCNATAAVQSHLSCIYMKRLLVCCLQVSLECGDQHQKLLVDVLEGRLQRLLQQAGLLPTGVSNLPACICLVILDCHLMLPMATGLPQGSHPFVHLSHLLTLGDAIALHEHAAGWKRQTLPKLYTSDQGGPCSLFVASSAQPIQTSSHHPHVLTIALPDDKCCI